MKLVQNNKTPDTTVKFYVYGKNTKTTIVAERFFIADDAAIFFLTGKSTVGIVNMSEFSIVSKTPLTLYSKPQPRNGMVEVFIQDVKKFFYVTATEADSVEENILCLSRGKNKIVTVYGNFYSRFV